jgi:hypothetical protein
VHVQLDDAPTSVSGFRVKFQTVNVTVETSPAFEFARTCRPGVTIMLSPRTNAQRTTGEPKNQQPMPAKIPTLSNGNTKNRQARENREGR